jgi:hypothetical protein
LALIEGRSAMSITQTRRVDVFQAASATGGWSPTSHTILPGTADRPKRVLCEFSGLQIMALLEALTTSDVSRDPQIERFVDAAEEELQAALEDLTSRLT